MREEPRLPSLLFGFFHRRRLLRGVFSFLDQERPRFDLVSYPCRNGRGTISVSSKLTNLVHPYHLDLISSCMVILTHLQEKLICT